MSTCRVGHSGGGLSQSEQSGRSNSPRHKPRTVMRLSHTMTALVMASTATPGAHNQAPSALCACISVADVNAVKGKLRLQWGRPKGCSMMVLT